MPIQALLDAIPAEIVVADAACRQLLMNRAARLPTGLPKVGPIQLGTLYDRLAGRISIRPPGESTGLGLDDLPLERAIQGIRSTPS